jgi:hypothetical protein
LIASNKEVTLVVDESHSLGVLEIMDVEFFYYPS